MNPVDFSPFGVESVQVRFTCCECSTEILSDEISVPYPDYAAEKASDSYNEDEDYVVCPNPECEEQYEITIAAGYSGGYLYVDKIEDDDFIEIIENDEELDEYYEEQVEAILSSNKFFNRISEELDNLSKLNDIELSSVDLERTLRRQLYTGAIACMEDYLSTTLIQEILNDDENFKKFVKSFKDIQKRRFNLNDIFDELEKLRDVVKIELLDLIYHDLPKISGIYKDSLGIDFPDFTVLMKCIKTRHDMVHRNGKTKEGVLINIKKSDVDDLLNEVYMFLAYIESKIDPAFRNLEKK